MKLESDAPWIVPSSRIAKKTLNPIRDVVENLVLNPNPEKPMIALSIGDPTVFGNLAPPEEAVDAVMESVASGKFNGYAPATGYLESRRAVAEYVSTPGAEVSESDVVLASGCSCALDLTITVLADPGDNILVPRPGFALYKTLAEGLGIHTREYDLLPEKNWEADLDHLTSLIDARTRCIVVNNPSNPCGSVMSKEHLNAILQVAEAHRLPIIADEIYEEFVFSEQTPFYRLASLTKTVPILSCGGLTKRFLCPGWRLGWIVIHDRNGILSQEVRKGLNRLSQRIIGANTLVQGALPAILRNTPKTFFEDTIEVVKTNADLAFSRLSRVPGLKPVTPQGAMYMMVGINLDRFPAFQDDMEFVEAMVAEESVFCLPGKCFNYPSYCRIVLTIPEAQMMEACQRMEDFCRRHIIPEMGQLKFHSIIPMVEQDTKPVCKPFNNGYSSNNNHFATTTSSEAEKKSF